MSNGEWRPKVGDRVAIYGTVTYFPRNDNGDECALVKIDNCTNASRTFGVDEIFPLPATPEPWETLREAADIMTANGHPRGTHDMRILAVRLEAAAAPKLPTLAEAVRAYSEKLESGASEVGAEYAAMVQVLARAENGA